MTNILKVVLAAYLTVLAVSVSEAKVVKYTLDIYFFNGSPDGVHKETILGINGQSPGPTLEANVGDTLEITLINSIQDGQNTSMHWHGIHQKGSIFEDGTSMATQCPLPAGASMVYRFTVTQPGTFWYHSHVNSQYTEGMFGPLIVHGIPEAHPHDGEVTISVHDWYHQSMHENEEWHLSAPARGVPPYPNSGLINGMGRYPCNFAEHSNRTCDENKQLRPVFKVQRDKVYRFRLINAAAVSAFNFSIDEHSLSTIEADGLDAAAPVEADIVPIAAGQRYSFLVKCKAGTGNSRYLIRANLRKESLMLIDDHNINKYPEALMGDVSAVLECTDEDLSGFKNLVEIKSERFTWKDAVPPQFVKNLTYLDEMKLVPLEGGPAPDYVDDEFVVEVGFYEDHEDIRRGSFNETPFVPPSHKPMLMSILDGETLPAEVLPLEIHYGSVVQLVINNPFFGPHPFHLHGHHFWVMGMGAWYEGSYDPAKHNLTTNGVKRDTVLVQEQSWAVIRFVADNPGVWVFHCHIDWHALTGMTLTFVEGADILRSNIQLTDEASRVCELHKKTSPFQSHPVHSHLSGPHLPHLFKH